MLSLKSNCAQRYYENTLKKTLHRGILTVRRLWSLRGTSEIQSSMYKTPHVMCPPSIRYSLRHVRRSGEKFWFFLQN